MSLTTNARHRRRADTTGGAAGNERLTAVTGAWLFLHKASFVLWFGVMTIHVLVYAPRLPRLLLSGQATGRTIAVLGGRGTRWLLLAASLACGLVLAAATLHLTTRWGATG